MQINCTGHKDNGRPCGFGKEIPDSAVTYEIEFGEGHTEERVRAHCPRCEKDMPFTVQVARTRKSKY